MVTFRPRHPLLTYSAVICLAALTILGPAAGVAQQPSGLLTGPAGIIDGDTLVVGGRILRLSGLDAPELDQTCGSPATARCGDLAAFALAGIVESHWLTCRATSPSSPAPALATCRIGGAKGIDIGDRLVASGWALAVPGDATYAARQDAARAARRGLWQGEFIAPWQWRAGVR